MKLQKNNPDIFGKAIWEYHFHGKAEDIVVHSPDFDDDVIPVDYLFRTYSEMPPLEQKALHQCRGKVLDIGCGAGSHALFLQEEKGLQVTAIDTSEGAIEVCSLRGIKDVRTVSFEDFEGETFDTLLLLMNGTGIVGRMAHLDRFFLKLKTLLNPKGQVLIDSSDLSYLFDRDEDGGIWIDASAGYYGELQYSLSYGNETSAAFDWLYLDFNSLNLAAAKNVLKCELLEEGEPYDYLAKLTLKA